MQIVEQKKLEKKLEEAEFKRAQEQAALIVKANAEQARALEEVKKFNSASAGSNAIAQTS
jgi:hypothetical protein